MAFTLGIDFGTASARALVVRAKDGAELASAVVAYPSGQGGVLLDPRDHNLARQRPADHLYALERSVRAALTAAEKHRGFARDQVIGVGVDTTGSSPIPVDRHCQPLAFDRKWKHHLAAQCWLWKDHTSWEEAAAITAKAAKLRPRYLAKCGNTYSSEWWWSKLWHCLNTAPEVFAAAYSWVELCDWIPAVLAGVDDPAGVVRGICAAGHKAMYHEAWGGLPDAKFLRSLDPALADLRPRLYERAYDASVPAGHVAPAWAQKLGLRAGIPIAIGEFDVHYGAIGCGVKEGTLVKVIGTSTCDCAVVSSRRKVPDIPGICGIVPGAILPGFQGIEAGQSAVGDIFAWWVEGICGGGAALHQELAREAAKLRPGQSGLLALDWHNGNRTILVDPRLTGLIAGCTLHTTRAEIYRALIEATAFGGRVIIERLREYGVPLDHVICAGGIAEKNPLLMQIYADVTGCTMHTAGSGQACALGAAIAAAVMAGAHRDYPSAQRAMTRAGRKTYRPRAKERRAYDKLYRVYRSLHDGFGSPQAAHGFGQVMKTLLELKHA